MSGDVDKQTTDGPLHGVGISRGDTLAARSAFEGVPLALDARGAAGQVVDAAIADACPAPLESAVPESDTCGVVRESGGSLLPGPAPSSLYRSRDDGWVVVAANQDTLWRRPATAMGRPEPAQDKRLVCGPVYWIADIMAGARFAGRGLPERVEDAVRGELMLPELGATTGSIGRPARWEVGADTEEVLAQLGWTAPEASVEGAGGQSGSEGVW